MLFFGLGKYFVLQAGGLDHAVYAKLNGRFGHSGIGGYHHGRAGLAGDDIPDKVFKDGHGVADLRALADVYLADG